MRRRPPDPYRIPPDPGYIGGYNWPAMLTGLGLLLCSNIAATEWIAYQFRYQAALGEAWFRTRTFALYSPFSWCVWLWRYGGSTNPNIRYPVDVGVFIIAAGCLATLGTFFALNMQRTKRLSRNAEDIHGSARWANEDDLRQTGL